MVLGTKFIIPEINNLERISASFKVALKTFYKNAMLGLDRVLSHFPEVEDFYT